MANVRGMGNTPADFYNSIPPITRYWATACFATTVLVQLRFLSPYTILMHWPMIWKLQLWRLVTNFFFLGPFSFGFLIQLVWIVQYGKALESSTFAFNTADYVYMLLFGMVVMLVTTLVAPFFKAAFLASPMVFMLLYVWSKNFPTSNVSIMGLFTVQAFYLPFCFLVLSLAMGGNWVADLLGILAGHAYYFLKVLHPAAGGAQLLNTPLFLQRWIHRTGVGTVPAQGLQGPHSAAHPSAPGFRAFQGRGRRLQ